MNSNFPNKYFVVTVGRTGSSLLCAVMADAGADFGMPAPESWDPGRGVMENLPLRRAAHHYRRAWDIDQGRHFNFAPAMESKLRRALGRRHLRNALGQAQFFKGSDLDLLAQPCFKLGYAPKLIVSYRELQATLPSLLVGRTNVGPDELAEEYLRVYRQSLALLSCFGGCVVPYAELHDASYNWGVISELTGLAEEKLTAAAERRCEGGEPIVDTATVYPEAQHIYLSLQSRRGELVPASRQFMRKIGTPETV
jgi:hypothetical protein